MSPEGLLLRNGSAQSVRVRVAADFMTAATDKQLVGQWSRTVSSVTITPGSNLLLHARAQHTWGKNFTAKCSAAAGYEALYPGLSKASIDAALGGLHYDEPHRPKKSQPLQREGLQGVVHTLMPGDVLTALGPELAAEVDELLFQAVDEGEE
ncbi:hypothetical protein OEZ86_007527 [Tetradesmus obliquus]|nr:hypothetical protein OEZ86_007527 [Tetradesmus obliquus]